MKVDKKVKDKLVPELRKHLLVADFRLTSSFLEEVNAHYKILMNRICCTKSCIC